jgi:iron complex outermembrane receptor protein
MSAAFAPPSTVGTWVPLPTPKGLSPNIPVCASNPANVNVNLYGQDDGNTAKLSRTYQVTPQLTWHTPWAADLKYLGAYTTYYYSLYNDYDNTAISSYVFPVIPGTHACVVPGVGAFDCPPLTVHPETFSHYVETKKYFSNEINITSHSDSSLQWILGLFQYNERNFKTPGTLSEPGPRNSQRRSISR